MAASLSSSCRDQRVPTALEAGLVQHTRQSTSELCRPKIFAAEKFSAEIFRRKKTTINLAGGAEPPQTPPRQAGGAAAPPDPPAQIKSFGRKFFGRKIFGRKFFGRKMFG